MHMTVPIEEEFADGITQVRPEIAPAAGRRLQWLVKVAIDRIMALALLVMLWPALLVLMVLIMSADFGWPFYAHQRVGRGGKRFHCLKIRSMRRNSAEMLADLLASDEAIAQEWEAHRKLRNDPRIIPFGRFIRATSLDELPQLLNIIKGDMSFVGPRPVTFAELARYGAASAHYLAVSPGLTGPWQVSGRSNISYAERVALDVEYVETWSLPRDLRILLRTPRAVFAMAGAC